jgi:hypothetical protein
MQLWLYFPQTAGALTGSHPAYAVFVEL